MCVNDIACAGGEPLFFLDYIACGKNYPEKIAAIVKWCGRGLLCSPTAALIGGETAEHPGLMPEDEYDLAGFAVGVVDKKDLITGAHHQGRRCPDRYRLVRRTQQRLFPGPQSISDGARRALDTYYDALGTTLGEALLAPTRIYVKALKQRQGSRRDREGLQPYHRRRFL